MKKQMLFKTKGMNQDLSVSAFNPEFSFENMNLRLSTNEGNTLMSWVNEKGTAAIKIYKEGTETKVEITGIPLGTAVLNSYLIVFLKDISNNDEPDKILRFKYKDKDEPSVECKELFAGYLDFDVKHPIETLVSYESKDVQKVYWVDGKNQPRVINICKTYPSNSTIDLYNPFDFISELQLNETVTVKKILGGSGTFAPGVIQYAFTYFNKYGQETNIFYTSPLLYTSYRDRGASPEDKVENAFRITVTDVDRHFDYLRIYSIQRTSINGTPICKRIQDIDIQNITPVPSTNKYIVSYIDTGTNGDSIDPTELLYKGGEAVIANSLELKDNTLFLGNISIDRPNISVLTYKDAQENIHYIKNDIETELKGNSTPGIISDSSLRTIYPEVISNDNYQYANQLTAYSKNDTSKTVPCGGFKKGDYYRLGVQFQYKTGKWSDPIFIKDIIQDKAPSENNSGKEILLPRFKANLSKQTADRLIKSGYLKVRGVVVFPELQDRVVMCQGVANPTMYTKESTETGGLGYQSSWFFRPAFTYDSKYGIQDDGTVVPFSKDATALPYANRKTGDSEDPTDVQSLTQFYPNPSASHPDDGLRKVEIQGDFADTHKFKISRSRFTLHSPDVEFDDQIAVTDFSDVTSYQVGSEVFSKTFSDIDIQTESPAINGSAGGFVHKSFVQSGLYGIVSGLFYEDFIVDDSSDEAKEAYLQSFTHQKSAYKWMVYLWNKNGSLNNDINRPSDKGTQTAKLKKKIISNLRYASYKSLSESKIDIKTPELFSIDEVGIVKVGDTIYRGNIDTVLVPDNPDGMYYAFDGNNYQDKNKSTPFTSTNWWKLHAMNTAGDKRGVYRWTGNAYGDWQDGGAVGDAYADFVFKKEGVRMKYKSTPHLFIVKDSSSSYSWENKSLPVIEIRRKNPSNITTRFGGTSDDAIRENIWLPCGEPRRLDSVNGGYVTFYYEYGDTYFQRYDCLKTYPFTREDPNQVVEIGSFMLETHINIDGRYDRNRGNVNNLNMSPQNFNLMNPVYSQKDNFFQYRIMPEDYYQNTVYPNQITWSKTKESGADVDLWTNMTLASVLELDGDKGKINVLRRLNDQLLCFQDTGISQILYNENVQISSTEGVPIEIANSGKVQGKRYLSNTIGCSNKWSMVTTPLGIYFMDSNDKSIYRLGEGLQNLSQQGGFNTWCKQNIPAMDVSWTSEDNFDNFATYYDRLNQDILFINKDKALAWSEKLQTFTSFYDYGNAPFLNSLNDTGIWTKYQMKKKGEITLPFLELWKHQAGDYCKFFDENKPYWMTLVGNPEPQMDKIFTNLEFRACVEGEGKEEAVYGIDIFDGTFDLTFHSSDVPTTIRFVPYIPFDSLETWDEYQHGIEELSVKNGHSAMMHHTLDNSASIKRKFRIWRCDIPRDNAPLASDAALGVSRVKAHPIDRMRNPWLYLKLQKDADTDKKVEIHDIVMTYFT